VASKNEAEYQKTYHLYDPLWPLLSTDASVRVRKRNYERVFDEGRKRVRAWEAKQGLTSTVAAATIR
jgi:hypothetical protein